MAGRGHRLDSLKTRRLAANLTITGLARLANVSDNTVKILEDGGTCGPEESARILNAIVQAVALTSNTQASPTVFTSAAHQFVTGDTVTIAGVAGATADPNGSRVVTVVNGTSFSVPVNCGVAGGTGGTATPTSATLGLSSLI